MSNFELNLNRIWKMALGNTTIPIEEKVFEYCMAKCEIRLGWGGMIDFKNCSEKSDIALCAKKHKDKKKTEEYNDSHISMIHHFKNTMKVGDLVIISHGTELFRAIGEIKENYRFEEFPGRTNFAQTRDIHWHCIFNELRSVNEFQTKKFSYRTLHKLHKENIKEVALAKLINSDNK